MAESDPRKIRQFVQPDRRNYDADEDPLVELARIVSEDSGFYGAREKAPAPAAPPQRQREAPVDRNAVSADLEAELLQELESSFASRSSAPQSRSRAPVQPAFTPPANDEADNLLRSIEEQLGEFERSARNIHPVPSSNEAPVPAEPKKEVKPEPVVAKAPAPVPAPPKATANENAAPEPQADATELREPSTIEWLNRPSRPAAAKPQQPRLVRPPEASRPKPVEDTTQRPVLRRQEASAQQPQAVRRSTVYRDQNGLVQPGFTAPAEQPGEPAAENAPQLLRRERADRATTADRIAASLEQDLRLDSKSREPVRPVRPDLSSVETELTRELEPTYADPTFDAQWEEAGNSSNNDASNEAAVAIAAMPPPRRSGKGLATAAGVLGVVVLGAALAVYLRSGEETPSGPPQVIAADDSAVKVEAPEAPAAEDGDTVGDAVYERVAGVAEPTEEQVVESSEEPREVARIVLPPSQEDSGEALVRPVGEDTGEVFPGARRVRTYVVRPDGTIAEGEAPAVEASPPAEEQVAAVAATEGEPIEPLQVATTELNEAGQPVAEEAVAAPAAPENPPEAAAEPATPPLVEMATAETPEQAAAPEPVEQPVDLLAPAPAEQAAAPAADTGSGGFVVQVSSQRSQEQALASFADMQARYPAVLGDYQPLIQQADLGDQGIYYRVRVGPWADRAQAVAVCQSLQAAGGDCFVTD